MLDQVSQGVEPTNFFGWFPKVGLEVLTDQTISKQLQCLVAWQTISVRLWLQRIPHWFNIGNFPDFFYGCLHYDIGHACPQSDHVQEFILHRLSPKAPAQARRLYDGEEDVEVGSNGECIADGLCIGDNVVVRAPDGGEPYWLMMVVIPTHTVLETFTDPDANTYLPSDVVFTGYWYK
jgi:hypothetical protein